VASERGAERREDQGVPRRRRTAAEIGGRPREAAVDEPVGRGTVVGQERERIGSRQLPAALPVLEVVGDHRVLAGGRIAEGGLQR
jgi:hypothetical protein